MALILFTFQYLKVVVNPPTSLESTYLENQVGFSENYSNQIVYQNFSYLYNTLII